MQFLVLKRKMFLKSWIKFENEKKRKKLSKIYFVFLKKNKSYQNLYGFYLINKSLKTKNKIANKWTYIYTTFFFM